MAYFHHHRNCQHYPAEWQDLVNHIQKDWPVEKRQHLGELTHQIEAKALHVFSVARHLLEKAEMLAENGNWKPVFLEATLLLFPLLEIIGEARIGNIPNEGSWRRLASGVDWLIDPEQFPLRSNGTRNNFSSDTSRIRSLGVHMSSLPDGPQVREMYHLRNFLVHGLKEAAPDFDMGTLVTSMNYELPAAIINQSKIGLVAYWDQLRGNNPNALDWVTRLSEAIIYPFGILGSETYEKGLVDPDIVYWLGSL